MTTTAALQALACQVRRDTLQILDAARPAWLTYAPPGTSNHMLWHAGHALWLQDVLCMQLLSGKSDLPCGWADVFGMNCRPVSETSDWPSRDDLRSKLQDQLTRILQLLGSAGDERLAQTANPARGEASIAERIIHGWHDEAKHCGEMYLLLKVCRGGAR